VSRVLVVVLLLVLALSGCGSTGRSETRAAAQDTPAYDDPKGTDRPSSGRPSRREYATSINEICADYNGVLEGISISTPGAQERLRLAIRTLHDDYRDLRQLPRPRGKAGRHARQFVRALNAEERYGVALLRKLGPALRRGDRQATVDILRRLTTDDPHLRAIRRAARALGSPNCSD
jgi:hypothetical protein